MGKQRRTFRQTKKSGSADTSAKNYARINRRGGWGKILNILNKGGKQV